MGRSSGTRRESEPFRFAVSGERAKLREAALKLGFPIDPQLFGAAAMAIAEREIREARENSELIPSAVPRFMESVLSRMVALRAARAEGIFRVPGDAVLLREMGEKFESGELTDAAIGLALVEVLRVDTCTLTSLDLSGNEISGSILARVVRTNTSLTSLDFRKNPIDDNALWLIGGLLLEEETAILAPLPSKAQVVWAWQTHVWTRALAGDLGCSPCPNQAFGVAMKEVMEARHAIGTANTYIETQQPFPYVHLLRYALPRARAS